MNRYERLSNLLELVADRGRLRVDQVGRELGVSAATIRRDLDHLAQQQLITRTRGGAVAHTVAYDLPLHYRTQRHATEKQRIARAAAGLVTGGMVVGLNGGTTTTEVARALATWRNDGSADGTSITVVTNALNIANELTVRSHVKIVVTGGVARLQSFELVGPLATAALNDLTVDIAFLGVDGFDADDGATAFHEGESEVNRLLGRRAKRVAVVADASKLQRRVFSRICAVGDVDTLITDTTAPDHVLARFREAGLTVLTA